MLARRGADMRVLNPQKRKLAAGCLALTKPGEKVLNFLHIRLHGGFLKQGGRPQWRRASKPRISPCVPSKRFSSARLISASRAPYASVTGNANRFCAQP